jgi:hypothetical protein
MLKIQYLRIERSRSLEVVLAFFAFMAVTPALADNPQSYTLTAPSVAHIQRGADGHYKIQAQESRFWLTQDAPRHDKFVPRLVTTTTNWSWDDDEKYSVVVTIDELAGRTPRRIAKFSDPGTTGAVLTGDAYYLTMKSPCCDATGHFWFRSLDTGKFLFKATGFGEVGATAFMYVQAIGAKLSTERWIGFEGNTDTNPDPTLLGNLRYGDLNGVLSDVQIRVRSDAPPWHGAGTDVSEIEVANDCSFLRWVEVGNPHSDSGRKRPAPGGCDLKSEYHPESFASLAGNAHPTVVNGIEVEYSISGDVYATIPIVNDRLDIDHAQISNRIKSVSVD